jgi:2-deoxy-D-gluconate 3-dehydrogenase
MIQHTLNEMVVPSFDLKGKVALVTGGTKGLGYSMSVGLASYGADVAISSRTQADCDRVSEEIRSLGRRSLGKATDAASVKQNEELIDEVVKQLGKIDIIVCNAGLATTIDAFKMTEEEWDIIVDTNLKGVFFSARAAAMKMVEKNIAGRIIITASAASFVGTKRTAHYNATKAGVLNLAKSLALEWAKYNITVNCVCPGVFPTNMNEEVMKDPYIMEKLSKSSPLRRVGRYEECTAAVLFLASDASSYVTGTHILVDGGACAGG